ncbi:rifin [Plasmodium reichenowi]|uniref:Rifin n=1 Tax=Plasmodium reichenowi TaxID=5854 RepID=A0A060RQA7_PLARE|nr:rifin [Plasmodium reichenowi]
MKLHCSKILLLFLPLNILLTSYHVYNNNEPQSTPHHTPTTTSRVLSESDTESSIYDNDEEINSVKEIFDRQTSQRFEEYQERMNEKRQKRKEQRDKNIQKIIKKDKMEKNLAEKIMCGCGLGSVAGSVGLFGGIIINIWKPGALKTAIAAAIAKRAAEISAAGIEAGETAGKQLVIAGFKKLYVSTLDKQSFESFFTATSYKNVASITEAVHKEYLQTCAYVPSLKRYLPFADANRHIPICQSLWKQTSVVSKRGEVISDIDVIQRTVQTMVSDAEGPAKAAAKTAEVAKKLAIETAEKESIEAASIHLYTTIGYTILAILIIVLIMVIIYLILRYRRKKKMKKKAQYTKLLNE